MLRNDENSNKAAGYICYGKRPLTDWTYDLYWIAVDPGYSRKGNRQHAGKAYGR